MTESSDVKTSISEPPERALARRHVEKKRKLRSDVVAYVVINTFLIGVWYFGDRGSFWPGWVLGGWGVVLLLNAWDVLVRRPVTETDIDREVQRFR